mgnify:FL=1|tara:strand:+ start:223 stop:615 length:393 start_codon:yes stop_codon:yes gene_type:complete
MSKMLSKLVVAILSLWALFIIISEIIGVTVYFPFNFVEKEEIPYHRIQSVRLSVFLTFIYFGLRYIFMQSDKLYPIQFLEIYIKSLTICGLFIFYSLGVELREYYFIFFFFIVSIILHIASRKKIRNYFS